MQWWSGGRRRQLAESCSQFLHPFGVDWEMEVGSLAVGYYGFALLPRSYNPGPRWGLEEARAWDGSGAGGYAVGVCGSLL